MKRLIGIFAFAFSLLSLSQTVWAAPISCTGSVSGQAGTCTQNGRCTNGTEEVAMSRVTNSGSIYECPDSSWMCCIPNATDPGTKPPKIILPPPPIDLPPSSCTGQSGRSGSCVAPGSCSGTAEADTSGVCDSAETCCTVPTSGGGCTGQSGRSGSCVAPGSCSGTAEADTSGVCDSAETCCIPNAGSGPGAIGSSCNGGNGTCTTIANCNATIMTVDVCTGAGLVCCPNGSATGGTPPTGGTPGVGGGSLDCTDTTKWQKIAGVCFPKNTGLSEKSVLEIIGNLVGWLFAIFGFIALLGFIISGLQYLFSAGDEGMAETAKRNMKYSMIGIIVALSGWIIIRAINTLLNANIGI